MARIAICISIGFLSFCMLCSANTSNGNTVLDEPPNSKTCPKGYLINAFGICSDVNECLIPDICKGLPCQNTKGSYYCVEDYPSDGIEQECDPGYKRVKGWFGKFNCDDIDECENPDICGEEECINSPGSYECKPKRGKEEDCPAGFEKGWFACKDIDECKHEGICGPAKCVNTEGSYICVEQFQEEKEKIESKICDSGYEKDVNRQCVDKDECRESKVCGDKRCVNNVGSYECIDIARESKPAVSCRTGEQLAANGSCIDIDECKSKFICGARKCLNTHGSYECISDPEPQIPKCSNGFRESEGNCVDVDECIEYPSICRINEQCKNYEGGYECNCRQGFERHHGVCRSLDPCASNPCSYQCRGAGDSFECSCPSGFRLHQDRRNCVDIDECSEGAAPCSHGCRNVYGTFECICPKDHKLQGAYQCVPRVSTDMSPEKSKEIAADVVLENTCPKGFYYSLSSNECKDIDECKHGLHNCISRNDCQNLEGSFNCKDCDLEQQRTANGTCVQEQCFGGYEFDDVVKQCIDINECLVLEKPCPEKQLCQNVAGNYFCNWERTCLPGFSPSRYSAARCEDVNECVTRTHKCSSQETCVNTIGSYVCKCPEGFTYRDGRCVDIDECRLFPEICPYSCINTQGSYKCSSSNNGGPLSKFIECPSGSRYDTQRDTCMDIDECSEQPNICRYRCINLQGSYLCQCPDGSTSTDDKCVGRPTTRKEEPATNHTDKPTSMEHRQRSWKDLNFRSIHLQNVCGSGSYIDPLTNECKDIDECLLNPNPCRDFICKNTRGSFECVRQRMDCRSNAENCENQLCYPGYKFDPLTRECVDINECERLKNPCTTEEVCHNINGAFYCQNCKPTTAGWRCYQRKECVPGMRPTLFGLPHCVDIDECKEFQSLQTSEQSVGICKSNEKCVNTLTSYRCEPL